MLCVGACASPAASDGAERAACDPSVTELNPSQGIEVRADSPDDVEGWALIFNHWPLDPGDVLTVPAAEEVKIVWRLTGDGDDVSFQATGPEGQIENLSWGPAPHGGSNWERPGQEWGTGWVFPTEGCWVLQATRGAHTFAITVDVTR